MCMPEHRKHVAVSRALTDARITITTLFVLVEVEISQYYKTLSSSVDIPGTTAHRSKYTLFCAFLQSNINAWILA
jgi:hypothetical protein